MIKVQAIDAGRAGIKVECSIDGSLEQLAAETVAIINGIYNGIDCGNSNIFELALFRAVIMDAVNDENSSAWDLKDEDEIAELEVKT